MTRPLPRLAAALFVLAIIGASLIELVLAMVAGFRWLHGDPAPAFSNFHDGAVRVLAAVFLVNYAHDLLDRLRASRR